ncbi:hypothetical protein D9M72_482150 [compost metagenome]
MEAQFGLLVARERHAAVDQPLDRLAPVLHDKAGCLFVAQSCAGNERVLRVLVMAVAGIQHGGDAALCPVAGALRHGALAEDDNPVGVGQLQRDRKAGQPAADDGDIEIHGAERAPEGARQIGETAKSTPCAPYRAPVRGVGWAVIAPEGCGVRRGVLNGALLVVCGRQRRACSDAGKASGQQKAPQRGGAFCRDTGSIT